jgi:hypothetical protein
VKVNFKKKFKYENVIKMKNKPDPAISGGSHLFNEIKKRKPKSRETIPLNKEVYWTLEGLLSRLICSGKVIP